MSCSRTFKRLGQFVQDPSRPFYRLGQFFDEHRTLDRTLSIGVYVAIGSAFWIFAEPDRTKDVKTRS